MEVGGMLAPVRIGLIGDRRTKDCITSRLPICAPNCSASSATFATFQSDIDCVEKLRPNLFVRL